MRIQVKSDKCRSERTTKGSVIWKQQAAMDQGGDFPLVFEITIAVGEQEVKGYPPGDYILDPNSFRRSRFGSLELDPYSIKLVSQK